MPAIRCLFFYAYSRRQAAIRSGKTKACSLPSDEPGCFLSKVPQDKHQGEYADGKGQWCKNDSLEAAFGKQITDGI